MIFFDFLYYCIYKFYSDYNEKGAESTSAGIVGGFQTVNILTILFFIYALIDEEFYLNKILAVVVIFVFQVFTYIRYIYKESHSVDLIEKKWMEKSETSRRRTWNFLFFYGVMSLSLFIGLAIYLGARE